MFGDEVGITGPHSYPTVVDHCRSVVRAGLQELDQALVTLDGVSINLKRKLIEAAAATVSADGYLQIQEAELLRAISDSLGCPMPPLAIALATAA